MCWLIGKTANKNTLYQPPIKPSILLHSFSPFDFMSIVINWKKKENKRKIAQSKVNDNAYQQNKIIKKTRMLHNNIHTTLA